MTNCNRNSYLNLYHVGKKTRINFKMDIRREKTFFELYHINNVVYSMIEG